MHCTVLTELYCTNYTVQSLLHCTVLTELYCTHALYCTHSLYCTLCTVLDLLHCTVLTELYCTHCTVLYSLNYTVLTALYCTYCTVLNCTILTAPHSRPLNRTYGCAIPHQWSKQNAHCFFLPARSHDC